MNNAKLGLLAATLLLMPPSRARIVVNLCSVLNKSLYFPVLTTMCLCRYNIATGLTERAKNEGELAQAGILVWLRYMATRQLTWNKNYNVKPRLGHSIVLL